MIELRNPSPSNHTGRITPEKMRILARRVEHNSPVMAIVANVIEAVNQSCTPKELTDIIQKSPELSMKVVRVANSAAFGFRAAQSVREAVDLLGWQRIASIVMTIGVREKAEELQAIPFWDAERYQRRCVALALISQLLSMRVDPWNEEKYYMCGLFQEWGYLMLAQHAPHDLETIANVCSKTAVDSPVEIERFYIESDHAELGGIAAEEYGLAADIVASIRYHHDPANAEPELQKLADVAHVASWVAGEMGIQVFDTARNHRLDQFALMRLGWSAADIDSIKQAILNATLSVSNVILEG